MWPNPELDDGGSVVARGPAYDEGGIYDPAKRAWTTIPTEPEDVGEGVWGSLVIDRLVNVWGHFLDPVDRTWTVVPTPPGGNRNGDAVIGGDDIALLWGGAPYGHESEGSLATGYLLHISQ
jgi:hypothetical protein